MKLTKAALLASSVLFLAACGGNDEPAECTKYFEKVNACVSKMDKAAGEQFKKSMDQARESWKSLDKKQLAAACKQADDAWASVSSSMGC